MSFNNDYPHPAQNQPLKILAQVATRAARTREQVDTLLLALGHVEGLLNVEEEEWDRPGTRFDGGIRSAAEATALGLLSRLDRLVEDDTRWVDKLEWSSEHIATEAHEEQQAYVRAATKAKEMESRPSAVYRASIRRTANGYIAHYGDLENLDNVVIGSGKSVEEAMADFDKQFTDAVKAISADAAKKETQPKRRKSGPKE